MKTYPLIKEYGKKGVEKEWKKAIKLYKSGEYYIDIANFKDSWGAITMKHIAQEAVRQDIVRAELKKRK